MVEGHAAENFDDFGWLVKLLLQVSLRDMFLEVYVRLKSYPATLVFRQAPRLGKQGVSLSFNHWFPRRNRVTWRLGAVAETGRDPRAGLRPPPRLASQSIR